jgi:hypothetical protein
VQPDPVVFTTLTDLDPATAERLGKEFRAATPFPHIVIDDVIDGDPDALLATYPPPDWPQWGRFRDTYQAGKRFCADIDRIPEPWAGMIRRLCEPRFLATLETITGITGLIPDPYLEGGGLHCSAPGGVLAPHTDFHVYRRLGLYRRVNLLLYLNPGWEESFGGCLELWEKGAAAPSKLVVPAWGRCVIFQTDDQSVHGFSQPVHGADDDAGEQPWRRSIALYYYTSTELAGFSGDTTTYWQQHGDQHGLRRLRMTAYRALLFCSRALSFLAHRANPNVGSRARPERPRDDV